MCVCVTVCVSECVCVSVEGADPACVHPESITIPGDQLADKGKRVHTSLIANCIHHIFQPRPPATITAVHLPPADSAASSPLPADA